MTLERQLHVGRHRCESRPVPNCSSRRRNQDWSSLSVPESKLQAHTLREEPGGSPPEKGVGPTESKVPSTDLRIAALRKNASRSAGTPNDPFVRECPGDFFPGTGQSRRAPYRAGCAA